MVIRNKCEGFYNHFSSVEDRIKSDEIKQLVVEKQSESGLYELCKRFADIGINAPKQKVDKIGTVQGCFQFKDIEAAKQAFMFYIEEHEIKDVEGLLQAVEELHQFATEDGVCASGLVRADNDGRSSMLMGTYVNFSKLPDDIWKTIRDEILETVK